MNEVVRLLGLVVSTDLPLPGATPAHGEAVDLEVRCADAGPGDATLDGLPVAELAADGRRFYTLAVHPDGWLLRVHGVCDFEISSDLSSVWWRTASRVDHGLVSVLLSGTLVAVLCRLRGECVLHASAVELGGRACGFFGASGTGKSTVAALLATTRAALVADGVVGVTTSPLVHVIGRAGELRLRDGAQAVVERFAKPPPVRTTADGRLAIRPSPSSVDHLPLGVLVAPSPVRAGGAVAIDRLEPAEAIVALTSADRILGWQDPTRAAEHFGFAADLAEQVPVVRLRIPWQRPIDPSLATDVRQALEEVPVVPGPWGDLG